MIGGRALPLEYTADWRSGWSLGDDATKAGSETPTGPKVLCAPASGYVVGDAGRALNLYVHGGSMEVKTVFQWQSSSSSFAPSVFGMQEGRDFLLPCRFRAVEWNGRCLRLQCEIACQVSIEDGLYVIQYEPLGIRAYASSYGEARDDFREEFLFIWDDYGKAADEELSPSGKRLKEQLRQCVLDESVANDPPQAT